MKAEFLMRECRESKVVSIEVIVWGQGDLPLDDVAVVVLIIERRPFMND